MATPAKSQAKTKAKAKAAKAKATRRTVAKKTTKVAKGTARKKAAPKKTVARAKPAAVETLARLIIRATQNPDKYGVEDLYCEDCQSWEPGRRNPDLGHEGRRAKDEDWNEFQDSGKAVWTARNLFVKRNIICIEWQADLVTRDGRSLQMDEVAVYQTKAGKIATERFYYDTALFAPPAAKVEAPAAAPVVATAVEPEPPIELEPEPPTLPDLSGDPDLDPIDL